MERRVLGMDSGVYTVCKSGSPDSGLSLPWNGTVRCQVCLVADPDLPFAAESRSDLRPLAVATYTRCLEIATVNDWM